jgi:hypothetical protein
MFLQCDTCKEPKDDNETAKITSKETIKETKASKGKHMEEEDITKATGLDKVIRARKKAEKEDIQQRAPGEMRRNHGKAESRKIGVITNDRMRAGVQEYKVRQEEQEDAKWVKKNEVSDDMVKEYKAIRKRQKEEKKSRRTRSDKVVRPGVERARAEKPRSEDELQNQFDPEPPFDEYEMPTERDVQLRDRVTFTYSKEIIEATIISTNEAASNMILEMRNSSGVLLGGKAEVLWLNIGPYIPRCDNCGLQSPGG